MNRDKISPCFSTALWMMGAAWSSLVFQLAAHAQEPRAKIRISNSTLISNSLPLVAAQEWKFFRGHGLEVEIIIMGPSISAPALISLGQFPELAA